MNITGDCNLPDLDDQLEELCGQRSSSPSAAGYPYYEQLETRRAQARDEHRQRREEWADVIRSREAELRENRFPSQNLNTLANAYFGLFAGADRTASPRSRIGEFIGGDTRLVDAVMAGLREAVMRPEVPEVERTISLHSESKHSWLAYPVLASLHLLDGEDPERLDGLDDARKCGALAIHYCVPAGQVSPGWHGRWLREGPELVLDVLYRCAVAAIRAGDEVPPGLDELETVTGCDELVHDVRLRLLRAFPTRGPHKQLRQLDRLLADVFEYDDKSALRALLRKKLSATSMTVAQRVRWLAADELLSPGAGFPELKAWVGESERRVRHLADFFQNISDRRGLGGSILDTVRDAAALRDTIEMLGHSYRPLSGSGLVTLDMNASDRISKLIAQLGSLAGDEAQQALRDLIDNPQLAPWKGRLGDQC